MDSNSSIKREGLMFFNVAKAFAIASMQQLLPTNKLSLARIILKTNCKLITI